MEEVSCSVQPNVRYAKLSQIFSNEVNLALKEGLQLMNHKFTGFTEKAMLSGVESGSSPVNLCRDENFQSNIKGIMPIGERWVCWWNYV